MAVGVRSGDVLSVGAEAVSPVGTGADSLPPLADDAGVGVNTDSSARGVDTVAVGSAGWSIGANGPHPASTVVTLDTRATVVSRTTSFLISLHRFGPKS